MFNRFFSSANRMSSTYKPVFLRALLDLADLQNPQKARKMVGKQWVEQRNGKIIVDLNFIVVRFAKYYWDMEYSFHLKHAQEPRGASITNMIERVHKKEGLEKPPTAADIAGGSMEAFRREAIQKSIKKHVWTHLLTNMEGLYEKDRWTITLDEDIVGFLNVHRTLLRRGINDVLTRYLEKINRFTPQISNKIDAERPPRIQLDRDTKIRMKHWQDSKCFYCRGDLSSPHVDHVIPFNYVFSTDSYNCTLACQKCNCTKSDKLPIERLFCQVLERNDYQGSYFKEKKCPYDENSYNLLYKNCAAEYNRDKLFEP
ncbi:HNH endonuclease [Cenarchaeum symbiosum A]|uniref:HNH endonuclease n=1 Tax=Cenarchaeum symbiosum (strain A) TaxID=414004 RepID=A0RU20_CENSY|nr:HNH endonuclease [Cenarchaeum symbiosum A]